MHVFHYTVQEVRELGMDRPLVVIIAFFLQFSVCLLYLLHHGVQAYDESCSSKPDPSGGPLPMVAAAFVVCIYSLQ